MILLQAVQADDAEALFPLIFSNLVADTLVWDGPESLESFRQALAERAEQVSRGERHIFTIVEQASGRPVGSASIRPDAELFRADMGLWIGQAYQNMGYGTSVIRKLLEYGFNSLNLEKIEAYVFVGNWASRRVFEKNDFQLEGTIRKAVRKRGLALDEWVFGITREDWDESVESQDHLLEINGYLFHICQPGDWQRTQADGTYAAESLKLEGFIHCSRADQVLLVANQFYRDIQPLVLLCIDPAKVKSAIKWEFVDGGIFPHIYGQINIEAIAAVIELTPDPDGFFRTLPQINPSS